MLAKVPAPTGPIDHLPIDGPYLAWTADDGASPAVITAYAEFVRRVPTIRLTLFVTGFYDAWTQCAPVLRPLVDEGRIQLANHTWNHPDLTSLSDGDIVAELQRTHDFIWNTYAVDARPFFRPPYGYRNSRVDRAASSIGYSVTTMWYGSLADSSYLPPEEIVRLGNEWFTAGRIVIAHLNHDPIIGVMDQLAGIVQSRSLIPVTLNDVFSSSVHP
ncbi:polysaccharide deacetylase family protein [Microbacterium sp. E-13]|uniref:polysaccharide deacetylase family protein n=1 Tax=Microbacterium sp. E-13 TaxID=3404048 RepID=UPI003CED2ED4